MFQRNREPSRKFCHEPAFRRSIGFGKGHRRLMTAVVLLVASVSVAVFAAPGGAPKATDGPQPAAEISNFPDWVPSVAFSPDGQVLAAGSYGVIRLFNPADAKPVGELSEPAGFVKSLAFSRDGSTLASGSYQVISIWNVAERKLLKQLKGHRGYVTAMTIGGDGQTLATASEDETVRLWDLKSGELKQTIPALGQPALSLAMSKSGNLAVGLGDPTRPTRKGAVRVYDQSGKPLWTGETHARSVAAVAFSPDGSQLATGSADESIKFWEASSGKELKTLAGHERPVNSLVFHPDGKWLFSSSGGRNVGGNEIKVWDVTAGKDRVTVSSHEGPVLQVALSRDGALLASASSDKTVKLWQTAALIPGVTTLDEKKTATVADAADQAQAPVAAKALRVGIIGLDTSHSIAFTEILNAKDAQPDVSGCRVVAAYPKGSPDIVSSTQRVPEYTKKVQELGVEIVDSIDALLEKVDVVLLESNDGRPHLEQVLPVLKAGKPVFIDKPIAGSLADAVAIFEAGRHYKVPLFSSSSLRYTPGAQAIRAGKIGEVKGCDAYSPCSLEATHPDLFWYGIHGVESLFTVMGTGCESVTRVSTPAVDVAVGLWNGERIGTFRGVRSENGGGQAGYGGTAFGTKGIDQIGTYGGYRPLVVEIVNFFRTQKVPIAEEETLEIYAFMEAADESKRQGGVPVKIATVLEKARVEAKKRFAP